MVFTIIFGTAHAELGENFMRRLKESPDMSRGASFRVINTEHLSLISRYLDYKIQEETIYRCVTYLRS
jgi:hypothetical protein